ncbi:hypothetical protein K469DRAFT_689481 [Zopfia rhizophila CBS 207.26]|uniref:LPXTG-domain-containing protein n=1 Tax=Zopfia rhizophila CBS 207.26 TaxID=1314779 RepID=A0A6A6DYM4_9PEZI|nr:hypothetical protein K469DRAFT_689481 [Zopfia rhizophila CBS 207.26]
MAKSKSMIYPLLFLLLFSPLTNAIEVAPNSKCASKCLDDPAKGDPADRAASLTFHPDLACYDSDYNGANVTYVGKKFRDCVSCLQDSSYIDGESGETDLQWFSFNTKATVDWCIFGRFGEENAEGNETDTLPYKSCYQKCSPIENAIDYNIKSQPAAYTFCSLDGNFTKDVDPCIDCLYGVDNSKVLGNILTAVKQVCLQRPTNQINLKVDLFTATRINTSDATPTASPIASTAGSPPASTSLSSSSDDSNGISKGAIAGIVLGALVSIALILVGILLLLRRKKNKSKTMELPNGNGIEYGQQ